VVNFNDTSKLPDLESPLFATRLSTVSHIIYTYSYFSVKRSKFSDPCCHNNENVEMYNE